MTQIKCGFRHNSVIGARMAVDTASSLLDQILKEKGKDALVSFPDTAFYLPLINALLNKEIKTVCQLPEIIETAKFFINENSDIDKIFDPGMATLLASEIIEAVKYMDGNPYQDGYQGFIGDSIYRSLGLVLVDGRMPAVAVILGSAPEAKIASALIRELQSKNILSLLSGESKGVTLKSQLDEDHISLGLDSYVAPLGPDTTSLIHAINFVARVAVSFGGIKKGDAKGLLDYTKKRAPVFVISMGELDPLKISALSAAMKLGIPVVTDQVVSHAKDCQEIIKALMITEKNYSDMVSKAIQMRGIKIKVDKIDIPVPYSAAFEGERVRKEQMYVQFGGQKSVSFELVRMKALDDVKDGKVELIGPDIDGMDEGKTYPLGIIVDVAGRKMEEDFEPVLERQIHRFLNYAMGVFHIGQRDMNWVRISKDAAKAGLRIKDFGKILHAKFHNEYANIVDKVAVMLFTTGEYVDKNLIEAKKVYKARDERIENMTDDSVDTFYSCLLCTSFAPNHVCVISPERMGLCGAVSWLDAKAAYEITPTGGNKPIKRQKDIDQRKGVWEGVNEFVYNNSNQTIDRLSLYSLMDSPMSACGCFECVAAVMPEVNGVVIVNREYAGMTPIGMTFTTLAGTVGGGRQTPGFMGIAKKYITSRMFISAEGGLKRVVWMPKNLKEALRDQLEKMAIELKVTDLVDKMADETVCTESSELSEFLKKVNHPALNMEPLV